MAGSRMTFVAEFVDRLTGPSTKAKKAVEDLGKATADAAKKSEQANRRAEGSEKTRASTGKKTASDVERAEGRKQRAARDTAQATTRAAAQSRKNDASLARDTAAFEKMFVDSRGRLRKANGRFASSVEKQAWRAQRASRDQGRAATTAAGAIQQMSTRSSRSVSGVQSAMDRMNPGRMASRYESALGRMLSRTRDTAGKIESQLERFTKNNAVRGATFGATAVGGMALAGGAKRIADVQQADVVMETMGLNEQDRGELIGQYKGLAQNTPYSTGSISMLGSGLLSAGMSQDDLQPALKGAIDTGALYGMNLEDIGLPLKQIQAKGKLQGDDVNQLVDRGIPIYKWIAEQKGVDQSKVPDMVTKGQVSSDDVFKALAKNSEGGAEKAAGTLKGSWTNFLSSISQGGEAFLTPLVGPLTDLLKGAKDTISAMKPALSILGQVTGVIVKGLTPALPVLIPLVVGLGGGLLALAAAAKAALVIRSVATGLGLIRSFLGGRGRGRGATGAVGLFTEFLGGMRDGAREAYGQRGLGGLNTGLDTSTKKMDKAKASAKGLSGKLSGIKGGAAAGAKGLGLLGALSLAGPIATAVQGGSPSSGDESIGNATMGGSAGVDQKFKDAKWANGNAGGFQSFWSGTMNDVNSAGDAAAKLANMDGFGKAAQGVNDLLGFENSNASARNDLSSLDSSFAQMVQSGDTVSAGQQFNTLVFQAEAKGAKQADIMKLFPSYKEAVYGVFRQRGQQVDDNAVLAAMRSDKGFRSGGFTGVGASTAYAGPAHKGEYYHSAEETRRIGLPRLREFSRSGGMGSPVMRSGDTTSVQVSVDAAGATVEGAQAVGQSVEEAVARVLARRERRASNRHGTRELRGAH